MRSHATENYISVQTPYHVIFIKSKCINNKINQQITEISSQSREISCACLSRNVKYICNNV